jgi:SPP1 family phage portal protein
MSYGRRRIFTDATEITSENVVEEVRKAALVHASNRAEIEKLYEYYRGKTAILSKKKEIREKINHKVNENRAYEVVSFHKGYTFGEAIQYVRRENSASGRIDDDIAADINALNGYMSDADKAACDNELAEWLYVGGTSYRLTLANPAWEKGGDEPPFVVYALDPRQTFVVYSSGVDKRPVFAVNYVEREHNEKVYGVYTENFYYEFSEFGNVTTKANTLGIIPIIEYPADTPRLGVFEIVLPLLDALDELQSNRMDDVVQYVNSILAIIGGQVDEETYKRIKEWTMLCLPEGVDAKYLSATMNQNDVQTLKDDLYQSILTITGVPNRNGGSSTSDTGSAVIMRDGWQAAEARAKATELVFKRSEKGFLRLILRILRDTVGTKLRLTDIETHFTRRNYENIASKSQVLISMLDNPWIHPETAYASCGMFPDPESAYLQGKAWHDENEKKMKEAERNADPGTDSLPPVQQATGGPKGAGTDSLSEV